MAEQKSDIEILRDEILETFGDKIKGIKNTALQNYIERRSRINLKKLLELKIKIINNKVEYDPSNAKQKRSKELSSKTFVSEGFKSFFTEKGKTKSQILTDKKGFMELNENRFNDIFDSKCNMKTPYVYKEFLKENTDRISPDAQDIFSTYLGYAGWIDFQKHAENYQEEENIVREERTELKDENFSEILKGLKALYERIESGKKVIKELEMLSLKEQHNNKEIKFEKGIFQVKNQQKTFLEQQERLFKVLREVYGIDRKVALSLILEKTQTVKIDLKSNLSAVNKYQAYFVGRKEDLKTIWKRLFENKQVGVTGIRGMGGIGKSALVEKVCHYIQNTWKNEKIPKFLKKISGDKQLFTNGILWIRFEKEQTLEVLIQENIERQLGIEVDKSYSNDQKLHYLAQRIEELGDVLIILDSAEQHVENYRIVRDTFINTPLIITSRTHFEDIYSINIEELDKESSIKLFNYYYFLDGSRQELIPKERQSLLDLLGSVGYLPLAIKLLAIRARIKNKGNTFPITVTKDEFENKRLEILRVRELTLQEEKNKEVIFCFELTYGDLSPFVQGIFMRCGLFTHPFSGDRLKLIGNLDEEAVEDAIGVLLYNSLMDCKDNLYSLHPLLREFTLLKSRKANLLEDFYQDHLSIYLNTDPERFSITDFNQIKDLLIYCKKTGDFDFIKRIVYRTNEQLLLLGLLERQLDFNQLALSVIDENDLDLMVQCMLNIGCIFFMQGKYEESFVYLERVKSLPVSASYDTFIDNTILQFSYFSGGANFSLTNCFSKIRNSSNYLNLLYHILSNIYDRINPLKSINVLLVILSNLEEKSHNYLTFFIEFLTLSNYFFSSRDVFEKGVQLFEIAEKMELVLHTKSILIFLVNIAESQEDIEIVESYFDRYKKYYDYDTDKYELNLIRCMICYHKKDYKKALVYINDSDEAHKVLKRNIFFKLKKYDEFYLYACEEMDSLIEEGDIVGLSHLYIKLADFELKKEIPSVVKATEYYYRSLNTFKWFEFKNFEDHDKIKEKFIKILGQESLSFFESKYSEKYVLFKKNENDEFVEVEPPYPNFLQQKLPKEIKDKHGKEMVLIPEGDFYTFSKGHMEIDMEYFFNNFLELWNTSYFKTNSQDSFYLYPFYVDKYPVTNAEYKKFCEATSYPEPTYWKLESINELESVKHISHEDISNYFEWYNTNDISKKMLIEKKEYEKILITNKKIMVVDEHSVNSVHFSMAMESSFERDSYDEFIEFLFGKQVYSTLMDSKKEDINIEKITLMMGTSFKEQDRRQFSTEINFSLFLRLLVNSSSLSTVERKRSILEQFFQLQLNQQKELYNFLIQETLDAFFNQLISKSEQIKRYQRQHIVLIKALGFDTMNYISFPLGKEFVDFNRIGIFKRNGMQIDQTEKHQVHQACFRGVYPIYSTESLLEILK